MVDHQSHIKYPSEVMDGTCPEGFETRVVSLFYETIWNTYAFAGKDGRFTLSTGDTTGYGYHGEFMMGWDEGFLDEAVKTCTSESGEIQDCPIFTLQSDEKADQCKTTEFHIDLRDDCAGPRKGLCGPNPIGGTPPPPPPAPTYNTTVPIMSESSETASHQKQHHSSSTAFAVAGGATTPAPSPAPADDGLELLYTTTYTSAGAVYEEVVEETQTTVVTTATTTAGVNRRHLHHHAHRKSF